MKQKLFHIRKTFYSFCKAGNCLFNIAVFDAVFYTMINVSFKNNLTDFVKGGFRRIDLREYVFAGNILINHTVDRLNLSDDLLQSSVKVIRIHTLSHIQIPPSSFIIRSYGTVVKFSLSTAAESRPARTIFQSPDRTACMIL